MSTGLVIPQHVAAKLNARSETCGSCKWRHQPNKGGDIECRRNPPTTCVLLVPTQAPAIHRQQMAAIEPRNFSTFALVRDDHWCGEWAPAAGAVQ